MIQSLVRFSRTHVCSNHNFVNRFLFETFSTQYRIDLGELLHENIEPKNPNTQNWTEENQRKKIRTLTRYHTNSHDSLFPSCLVVTRPSSYFFFVLRFVIVIVCASFFDEKVFFGTLKTQDSTGMGSWVCCATAKYERKTSFTHRAVASDSNFPSCVGCRCRYNHSSASIRPSR